MDNQSYSSQCNTVKALCTGYGFKMHFNSIELCFLVLYVPGHDDLRNLITVPNVLKTTTPP